MNPEVMVKGSLALEKWRKEKKTAESKGGKFLATWIEEQRIKKEQKRISPQDAIRKFCNDCVGGIREDITNCTAKQCSLYIYRPYQNEAI